MVMLKDFLGLLPVLGWATGGADEGAGGVACEDKGTREQIAINTCLSAVQTYFPCDSTTTSTSACLCEHSAWRVACYDNHASIPSSHPARAAAETQMTTHCRSADVSTLRQRPVQRRQLDSILHSIGNDIASFFAPPGAASTSAAAPAVSSARASASPAPSTRGIASSPVPSVAKSSAAPAASSRPGASTLATQTTPPTASLPTATASSPSQSEPAASATSTPTASPPPPPSSSKPSGGLVAGVVIGLLLLFAAIGILAMLVLRRRRQARDKAQHDAGAEDKRGITAVSRSESMETTRTGGAVGLGLSRAASAGEKGGYGAQKHGQRSGGYGHEDELEMRNVSTQAYAHVGTSSPLGARSQDRLQQALPPPPPQMHTHVVEIDSKEIAAPVELEARTPLPDCLRAGRTGG